MRLIMAALAWLVWAASASAQAGGIGLEDLLARDSFGAISASPDGRWAVIEERSGYAEAPRFDLGHRSLWQVSRLRRVDLDAVEPVADPWLDGDPSGLVIGAWSPSGRRLLVHRLSDAGVEAGVVEVADGSVRWTGLTVDMPLTGEAAAWRDDRRLVLTVRLDASPPWILRIDGEGQRRLAARWADMRAGDTPSREVVDTAGGVAVSDQTRTPLEVIEYDVETGTTRRLEGGRILDLAVSPDGSAAAILKGLGGVPPAEGPAAPSAWLERAALVLVDLRGGATHGFPFEAAPHLLRWSPGSDGLLVWARIEGQAWPEGGLVRVGRDGRWSRLPLGGVTPFAPDRGIDAFSGVRADWLGDRPLVYGRRTGEARFDWFEIGATGPRPLTAALEAPPSRLAAVAPGGAILAADGRIWRLDRAGDLTALSPEEERWKSAEAVDPMASARRQWNSPPRRDWAAARAADGRAGVFGGRAAGSLPGHGAEGDILVAARETTVLALHRSPGAEALWRVGAGGRAPIMRLNPDLEGLEFGRPRPIDHLDRLGRPTRSWLYMPPDGAPIRGLVAQIYPGGARDGRQVDPLSLLFGLRPELLARAGYAVLSPSLPIDAPGGDIMEAHRLSLELALAAAVAAAPDLPADRLAVVGHSFGATTALGLAARSSRVRAVVAWAGATDLFGMWGERIPYARGAFEEEPSLQWQMGWTETGQGGAGAPPWERVETYAAASPYLGASVSRAPTLLITADRDFVPMSQSERMFTRLHREGVRARLVTYWGEGHFNWSPANIRDLYAQILDWLDMALAPEPSTETPPG